MLVLSLRYALEEMDSCQRDKLSNYMKELANHCIEGKRLMSEVFQEDEPVLVFVPCPPPLPSPPPFIPETKAIPEKKESKRDPSDFYEWDCPHCLFENKESKIITLKTELNCRRMIHGVFRVDFEGHKRGDQVPPHSHKAFCERALAQNAINGCGKSVLITGDLRLEPMPYEG